MDNQGEDLSIAIRKKSNMNNMYRLMNGSSLPPSGWFEIRLFYVRISPCAVESIPDHLNLRHLGREIGVALEINGTRVPPSETVVVTLRRDRIDKESSEVTYVSTDSVRVTGPVEFEVHEDDDMVLCGSLERMECTWSNGSVGSENNSNSGWSMDCYTSAIPNGSSSFFQPKLGISSPSIEVYVAGCCSGSPVILTKTILISPRRRPSRHGILDSIPEDEETDKEEMIGNNCLVGKMQMREEVEDYEPESKLGYNYYSEEMYGEDGQLSWFNAGVRVGVGIGLGMCVGVGIGVGLLMRSYQATTSTFRRRFF